MNRWFIYLFILICCSNVVSAKKTNILPVLKLNIENDYFSFPGGSTDRYYTNGIRIDYFYSSEKRNLLSSVLFSISDEQNIYGWGLSQNMFTPSEIDVDTVQYGDRPYAGSLFAIHSLSSYDFVKRIKLTSELYIGVLGPLSLAGETQNVIHRLINSTIPQGWDNQIPNDIVLNYNLHFENEIIYIPEKLLITRTADAFLGTMYDAVGAGLTLKMGRIENYLDKGGEFSDSKKFRFYIMLKPSVRAIYYNALLQGGFITNQRKAYEGYKLGKDEIERINVFTEFGVVLKKSNFEIMFLQKMRTAQFKGGNAVEFGSITLTFKV